MTVEEFQTWVGRIAVDSSKYLKLPDVARYCVGEGEEKVIMRIMFKMYLRDEAVPCYLTSKKAKRGVMASNLKCIRGLVRSVFV